MKTGVHEIATIEDRWYSLAQRTFASYWMTATATFCVMKKPRIFGDSPAIGQPPD